jgi:exonuclease SbcC
VLEKLTIRNFQKHRKLEVDFDRFITTLVGANDAGKSAVIRALRYLALNRSPKGHFVHSGTEQVSVSLLLDEGSSVQRKHGKGRNLYKLDGRVFSATSNKVPEAVAKLLNVGDVNFQGQHNLPFWFSETPGQVGKNLNAIINLDVIDKTLASINSIERKAKAKVELTQDRLKEAQARRRKYGPVRLIADSLADLERQSSQLELLRKRRLRLSELVKEIQALRKTLKQAAWGDLAKAIARLEKQATALKQLSEQRDALNIITLRLATLRRTKCQSQESAIAAEKKLHQLCKGRCPVCGSEVKKF